MKQKALDLIGRRKSGDSNEAGRERKKEKTIRVRKKGTNGQKHETGRGGRYSVYLYNI